MKYFFFLIIFTLFACCSFDNKTGIWSGYEKEEKRITELEEEQIRTARTFRVYSSEGIPLE